MCVYERGTVYKYMMAGLAVLDFDLILKVSLLSQDNSFSLLWLHNGVNLDHQYFILDAKKYTDDNIIFWSCVNRGLMVHMRRWNIRKNHSIYHHSVNQSWSKQNWTVCYSKIAYIIC